MKIFTIGFTKKSAEEFFNLLKQSGVKRLIDVRLNNESQLAGFAKKNDLRFFLKELIDCEYYHYDFLAPTQEILNDYRKNHDWPQYEKQFTHLLEERQVASRINRDLFAEKPCCLLCSEASPEHCHRRLVAEYLAKLLKDVEIVHL